MLTTGEVANTLGVSKTTVLNYETRGILVPERVLPSGRRLYSESVVIEFLKSLKCQNGGKENGIS